MLSEADLDWQDHAVVEREKDDEWVPELNILVIYAYNTVFQELSVPSIDFFLLITLLLLQQ